MSSLPNWIVTELWWPRYTVIGYRRDVYMQLSTRHCPDRAYLGALTHELDPRLINLRSNFYRAAYLRRLAASRARVGGNNILEDFLTTVLPHVPQQQEPRFDSEEPWNRLFWANMDELTTWLHKANQCHNPASSVSQSPVGLPPRPKLIEIPNPYVAMEGPLTTWAKRWRLIPPEADIELASLVDPWVARPDPHPDVAANTIKARGGPTALGPDMIIFNNWLRFLVNAAVITAHVHQSNLTASPDWYFFDTIRADKDVLRHQSDVDQADANASETRSRRDWELPNNDLAPDQILARYVASDRALKASLVAALRQLGIEATKRPSQLEEHLDWLIKWQVEEQTWDQITDAATTTPNDGSVRKEVKRNAAIIGLPLLARKAGRPKGK